MPMVSINTETSPANPMGDPGSHVQHRSNVHPATRRLFASAGHRRADRHRHLGVLQRVVSAGRPRAIPRSSLAHHSCGIRCMPDPLRHPGRTHLALERGPEPQLPRMWVLAGQRPGRPLGSLPQMPGLPDQPLGTVIEAKWTSWSEWDTSLELSGHHHGETGQSCPTKTEHDLESARFTSARARPCPPCQRQEPEFRFEALNGLTPVLMQASQICGCERIITGL